MEMDSNGYRTPGTLSEDEVSDYIRHASSRRSSRSSTISHRARAGSTVHRSRAGSTVHRSRAGSTVHRSRAGSTVSIKSAISSVFSGIRKLRKPDLKTAHILELEVENGVLKREIQKMKDDRQGFQQISLAEQLTLYFLFKLLDVFNKKLEKLDLERVKIDVYAPKGNVQVGDQGTMVFSDANETLLSFYKALETSVKKLDGCTKELKETSAKVRELDNLVDEYRIKNNRLEVTVTSLESDADKLQEVIENLQEFQANMDTRDNTQRMKLDYTLSLTDSKLMEKCIQDIQQLQNYERPVGFNDITKNSQFGVMRIIRKYCTKDPKLTVCEFAETLGVDVSDMTDDCLDNDTCTDILERWTHLSQNNTVDVLTQKFPKLKRYGAIYGNLGSQSVSETLSRLDIHSFDGTSDFLQEIKSWITEHTGRADDALFQRIKNAFVEIYLTAPKHQPLKRQVRSLDNIHRLL
ncbi:hypothetical protein ACF0H5_002853 [Mactra antiquata]